MNFHDYKSTITSDLNRISGNIKIMTFFRHFLFGETYRYIFWMRTCAFLISTHALKYTLFPIARIMLRHYCYKLGISIPYTTKIGDGLFIGHFGGIVINSGTLIGDNCNISQGVTIGSAGRDGNKKFPILGNNVYIGPGAKIVGGVRIGDNVAIGANSVVVKDIPEMSVVVGVPGKVISFEGSVGLVNNIRESN